MALSSASVSRAPGGWGAWVLAALFLVIAALVLGAVYFALPSAHHYVALVVIGIVALFFALGSYLAEAASRRPLIQRSLAWGFFGLGFADLVGTMATSHLYGVLSIVDAMLGLAIVLAALFVSVGLMMWRVRAVARTVAREAPREAWSEEPTPSALSYATATSPSVPVVTPPPAESAPPKGP
jgi:hypothetical protein